jgi:hypothetical protein
MTRKWDSLITWEEKLCLKGQAKTYVKVKIIGLKN